MLKMPEFAEILGRMLPIPFPESVFKGFNLHHAQTSSLRRMPGGEGTTYLLPNASIVFKPTQDPKETEVICNILSRLDANPAYQIAQPIPSTHGTFVYEGWSASTYLPDVRPLVKEDNEYTLARFREIIEASHKLHTTLRKVALSEAEFHYLRYEVNHLWSLSHRKVWDTETNPQVLLAPFATGPAQDKDHPLVNLVGRLVKMADRLGEAPLQNMHLYKTASQIVHGDVVGGDNVLFAVVPGTDTLIPSSSYKSTPPAIIDLSPTLAPAAYAEGILLADGLIWCRVGIELLDLVGGPSLQKLDMLRRGLLFRLLSDSGLVERGHDAAIPDLTEIERVTNLLENLIGD